MKIISTVFMLHIFVIVPAHADDGRIATFYGIGNESCGSYLRAMLEEPLANGIQSDHKSYYPGSLLYAEWINGFITSFNLFNDQRRNLGQIDQDGLMFWLKNYCELHPLDSISSAAWELVQQQGKFDIKRYR